MYIIYVTLKIGGSAVRFNIVPTEFTLWNCSESDWMVPGTVDPDMEDRV